MFYKTQVTWFDKIAQAISFLVIVSLLLSPAAPVFAQEAPAPIVEPPPVVDTPTSPSVVDSNAGQSAQTPDTGGTTPPDQVVSDTFVVDSPAVSASLVGPESLGDITYFSASPSSVRLDTSTGAFQQQVPIDIPPGRNGIQPKLSLTYNSQNYEDGSEFGFGWNITIPYIERYNRTGVDKLYTDSYFFSSDFGELSTTSVAGEYRPRTENGDFVKFVFSNNTWTMYDKQGVSYKFGSTTGAQLYDVASTSRIGVWMLEEIRDPNNNYVSYSYQKADNQIYPSSILYTGSATSSGIFSVSFSRETRPDPTFSYKYGFLTETKQRINQITVAISSSTVRSYALGYAVGNNGYRSMLSSVTETYKNADGVDTAYAPWQFSYTNNQIGFTKNDSWSSNEFTSPIYVPSDINGDGLTDIEVAYRDAHDSNLMKNIRRVNTGSGNFTNTQFTTSGHDIESPWAANPGLSIISSDTGTRLMDINGDMLPDVVVSYECSTYCGAGGNQTVDTYGLYLNQGGMQWGDVSTTTAFPIIVRDTPGTSVPHAIVALVGNVNGDAVNDIQPFDAYYSTSGQFGTIYIPNYGELVDLNHDGLDDAVSLIGKNASTSINTGGTIGVTTATHTFQASTTYTGMFNTSNEDGLDKGMRVVDINNDGLPDFIRSYRFDYPLTAPSQAGVGVPLPQDMGSTSEVWLNTGDGWAKMATPPYLPVIANPQTQGGTWFGDEVIYQMYDVDGDGAIDIPRWKNNTSRQDLMNHVVLPTGGTIDATSTPSTQLLTTTGGLANPSLPFTVWTVTDISRNDGFGNISTSTYSYGGGSLWYGGVNNRKYAAFATTTEYTNDGKTITYYHQGNDSNSSLGEYQDSFAKIGKIFRVEKYDATGNLYSKTITKWDQATTTYGNVFAKPAQKAEFAYDGNGTHKDRAESYTYDDTTGNLTQKKEWGEVTGSDDGSFSDLGTDSFTTTYAYATNASTTLNLLASQVKTDQSSNTVSESRNYYDNLSLNSATLGNKTKVERRIDGSTFASSTKSYNTFGLVTQEKDENANAVTYTYDSFNLYPATSTNALSQNTAYKYNYTVGKVSTTTDANGLVWVNRYDGKGRPVEEITPDPSATTTRVTKTLYVYTDTPLSVSVKKSDYLTATNTVDTYSYYDGQNRFIQSKKEMENGYWITKDSQYDNMGRLARESLPYFTTSSAKETATTSSNLFISYVYDTLGRVTQTNTVVGNTTTAYDDWSKTVTDPKGISKIFYNDAYDNLTRVDEHNATSTYTTTYTWDGNNALTGLTDSLGNVRSFTYDKLGRRLTAQDLHTVGDVTFGSWSYSYDPAGNLTQTTDPKSQVVNYTYDVLNRIKTEDYTGQAGTEVTYGYDSCSLGIGKVCVASSTSSKAGYTYTPTGLVAQATTTIAGTSTLFTTAFIYDRQSNQTLITYPDSGRVGYTYNTGGLVESVQRKEATDVSSSTVVSNFDYSPNSQPSLINYGNGVITVNTYDPAALYRLGTKLTTLPSSQKAQNISYVYDVLGNITQITDAASSTSASISQYSYDDLSRLTNWSFVKQFSTTTFTTSSTTTNIAYLIVGGGGGGGFAGGAGGGGAGGLLLGTTTVSTTAYTVTVGSGGGGSASGASKGSDGTLSSAFSLTANGGGGGGSNVTQAGNSGGSGGGSAGNAGTGGGTGTAGQGNNGGAANNSNAYGGGGGGAGAVGQSGQFSNAGNGGDGLTSAISGSLVTYAGGGGGATGGGSGNGGAGGSGGGGRGADAVLTAQNGTANTGGGGGAGVATVSNGGNGGSGVVIVSYPTGSVTATGGTITTNNGYTIHTFTSNGTLSISSINSTTSSTTSSYSATTTQAFTYNALGNITNGPLGLYSYTGNIGSNYANPHAVTGLGGSVSSGGVSTSTITLDTTSTNITSSPTGTTTKTWTHTVNGNSPVLVLTANIEQTATGTGSLASASWNGGAFTKATTTRMGRMQTEIWYLVATTTGAKSVSATVNGNTNAIRLGVSSFNNVSATWPLDTTKIATGTSGNPTISITPTMSTDVVVSSVAKSGTGTSGGGSTSTPAYVQSKKDAATGSATFTSSVTTGNTVVVGLTIWNTTVPSNAISDNKGNTYVKAGEVINAGTTDHAAIFYAKNVTGGSSFTVTSSVGGTIAIHEYSGLSTSSPLDKLASTTGTSAAPSSGNVTTVTSSELYFGLAWSQGNGDTWGAGSGYTLRENETDNNTNERLATEDAVIASASTTAARFTTTTSNSWAAIIATFKPSTTSGGGSSSADATTSQTSLWKDVGTTTMGAASYKVATASGAVTDTYTTAASQYWAMASIALRPATTTSGSVTASTTLTYDNNGNLTQEGTSTYTWNYRNQLTQSGNGLATSTYAYDHAGTRIKLTERSATTFFPNKYYNVMLGGVATSTKSIFVGDMLVATIENSGTASSGGGGSVSTTTTHTLYADALTTGWNDWSWNTTLDFNGTTTYIGSKSIKATYTVAWGGAYLEKNPGLDISTSTALQFAIRSTTAAPTVEIDAYGTGDVLKGYILVDNYIGGSMAANTWYLVTVPLTALGVSTSTFTGFVAMRSNTGVLYLDDIKLIATSTSGGGGSSATSTIRYFHGDHLGSTNVVTSATGTVVQVLDYYPYGKARINSSSGGVDEKRKFASMERDNSTGLDYAMARYYDNTRGQFLSQDPVFWEIGRTAEGKAVLSDPQLQNSYSWGRDNPITNKDPLGRYVELSGSLVVPGRAWSAGIRFDSNGIDYFLSGGAGVGLSAGFEGMWAPGVMLSHTNQASVSVNGTVADGIGGRISQNVWTYDPITKKTISNGDPVMGLVLGAGGGASVQFEGSAPIPGLVWNKPIAPSKLGSTANIPATISSYSSYINSMSTPYVVQNNTTYARTSGGLAPTSLPATISQGGATYYRNSSGLLSTKPGQ